MSKHQNNASMRALVHWESSVEGERLYETMIFVSLSGIQKGKNEALAPAAFVMFSNVTYWLASTDISWNILLWFQPHVKNLCLCFQYRRSTQRNRLMRKLNKQKNKKMTV